MTALGEIAAERKRQIEAEGWSAEHDDEHYDGSLALAAGAYVLLSAGGTDFAMRTGRENLSYTEALPPSYWPWDARWWKPKDRRRDLVRAAALIVAEIERIDRTLTPA